MIKEEILYKGKKITEGCMLPAGMERPLNLNYTELRAGILGLLADVTVIQKFHNDLDKNIEAVYVFPLPQDSAVYDLEIKINERIIRGEIKEKEEARRTYEEAKDDMRKAALLEQERPNLFTMSVANIEPGQEILITLKYYETIKYEDGEYEFIFPMTITPRYIDKDTVLDADKISPQGQSPQRLAGREVNIFINLDAGFEIGQVSSPTHLLFIQEKGKSGREIQLAKEGEVPNKDFILKYSSKGEQLERILSFYRKENKPGTFMLHLTPKFDYGPDEMLKREMIFVLDRSGSMSYGPMEQAKKALKSCLRTLRGGDSFSVITFDTVIERLASVSLDFNDDNLHKADRLIDKTHARGGTDILLAMQQALSIPVNKQFLRQIIFLTDGAVGNEEYVLKDIQKTLGKARIFTFGIGPSVNRYLLDKMAEMGRGTAHYLSVDQNIEDAIQHFSNQTSFPILSDIALEWKDARVADTYPVPIPDLYFGKVLYIIGRFYTDGKATAVFKSKARAGEFKQELAVDLPEIAEEHPLLETIWARKRIDSLLNKERENPKEKSSVRDEIIGLAMKYHLMSPYTSLVAVEEKKDEDDEKKKEEIIRIDVPTMFPDGLTDYARQIQYPACGAVPMGGGPVFGQSAGQRQAGIMRMPRDESPRLARSRSMSEAVRGGSPPGASKILLSTRMEDSLPPPAPKLNLNTLSSTPSMRDNFRGDEISFSSGEEMAPAMHPADIGFISNAPVTKAEALEADAYYEAREKRAITPGPGMAGDAAPDPSQQRVTPKVLDLSFKWLVRNQSAEGFWSKETELEKRVITTSLGLLAFIGQGHTNKTGKYMPQTGKALFYIQNNLDNISGLSFATAAWVFFELYNISGKIKEKTDAQKALKKLKDSWGVYTAPMELFFAGLAGRAALRDGLATEQDLPDTEKRISLSGGPISRIATIDDILAGFTELVSGNENFHNLLMNHYISQGDEAGSINVSGLNPMDVTSRGLFIISWPSGKLLAR